MTRCGWRRNKCSSVEQSVQNDARRLRSWLEHGSKAHLQRILPSSRARAARQAYTKAASASSLMHGGPLCRRALASCCSSIEQTRQNDARRLRRWLEHGSKARLQRILCSSRAGAARQAHAKAVSTSSLMGGKELFSEPLHRDAAPLSKHARTMPAASVAGWSTVARLICNGFYPVAAPGQRGKRTHRLSAQAVS